MLRGAATLITHRYFYRTTGFLLLSHRDERPNFLERHLVRSSSSNLNDRVQPPFPCVSSLTNGLLSATVIFGTFPFNQQVRLVASYQC
jgi:hypothetical protein